MNKIKIITITNTGTVKSDQHNIEEIKKVGNIIKSIKPEQNNIEKIYTVRKNYRGHLFVELNYDKTYEMYLKNHTRLERTNEPGYEDFTGYGCRTEGKKNRFYLGRSTGWIPVYLEILRSDSTGGISLSRNGTIRPLN